jgi:hypothetical protein
MNKIKRAASSYLADALLIAGVGLVSYGAWLVYEPAGFIVGGLMGLAGGILAAKTE